MFETDSRERSIFCEALDRPVLSERQAFVAEACGDDSGLRAKVEALLRAHDEAGRFLKSESPEVARTLLVAAPEHDTGTMIGPYKLREVLGEGGMGTVYVAEQERPVRRKVALKVIKPGMDTREVIARFEAERQALALMDHPNIAKVLDAGTTGEAATSPPLSKGGPGGVAWHGADAPPTDRPAPDPCSPQTPGAYASGSPTGRPYFVMELVRGIPITDYCVQRQVPPRERLALFIQVCQAVQHAHQKGIIHRDLKPSNVLVARHDDVPVPKVIDFGIAKATSQRLTEHTVYTRFSQMMGTPLYMSPEQAELNALDVDTRSDVYSLGVLLYELLTGATPFDKETFAKVGLDEVRRIIREDEPPRPSQRVSTLSAKAQSTQGKRPPGKPADDRQQHNHDLRGELDWIVMKALEKDRTRRYESASAFAADVQRYLDDEPVQACPPSALYRLKKLGRRNRTALTTTAIVLVALLTGTGVSVWQAVEAIAARKLADERWANETRARQHARRAVDEMYTGVAEKWLEQQPKLTAMQREFLQKALAYYREFADEKGSDPEAGNESVVALQRVGAIELKLGKLAVAETAFAQSVQQSSDLVSKFPDRPDFRLELARGRLKLANIFRDTGRTAEARQETLRTYEPLMGFAGQIHVDTNFRRKLAESLGELSGELTLAHQLPEADAAVRSALKVWKSLVDDSPADFDCRFGLASNYGRQGMHLMWWGGQDEKAEAALREADARLSILHEERPDDVHVRETLAADLSNLGVMHGRARRRDDQEKTFRRSAALHEGLVKDYPDVVRYQSGLALVSSNLGQVIMATDETRAIEGETYLRSALKLYETVADRQPDVPEHELKVGKATQDVARILWNEEKRDESCQLLARSRQRAKRALARDPSQELLNRNFIDRSTDLAGHLVYLVDHAAAAHALAELQSVYRPDFIGLPPQQTDFHVLVRAKVAELLENCIKRAERDASLSPSDRETAVRTYTEQAGYWRQLATRAAEEWARNEVKDVNKPSSWFIPTCERHIAAIIDIATDDGASPKQDRYGLLRHKLQFEALVHEMIRRAPDDPLQNLIANLLTTAPEELREPELALKVARRAVELTPRNGLCLQSLAWAFYRTGDWKGCIESYAGTNDEGKRETFVLAMAYWQLGESQRARSEFVRALDSVKGYEQLSEDAQKRGVYSNPSIAMVKRLQAEAAALLGVPEDATTPEAKTEEKPQSNSESE